MAIAAKRFSFLDKQTNVPVANFVTSASSDLLNSPEFDIFTVTDQILTLADANRIKDVGAVLTNINSAASLGLSRLTKDFFSNINILDSLPQNKITDLMFRYFPNDATLRNTFAQIGEKCKASILAGLGNCKNKNTLANFKGLKLKTNNRSCNLNAFVNLINRFTNGLYNPLLTDQCALARLVAGMAIRGFELGLPNVFSSISNQVQDKFLLAQAGATVMGSVALSGNMEAVIDVANSSVGSMIPALNPGITSMVFANYQIPGELKDSEIADFNIRFGTAMTNMDPSWNSMNFISDTVNGQVSSTIPSLINIGSGNDDLMKSFQCSAYELNETLPDLDGTVPDPTNTDYLLSGLTLDDSDTDSSLTDNFDYLYSIDSGDSVNTEDFFDW